MIIRIISFTAQGGKTAEQIRESMPEHETLTVQRPEEGVGEWVKEQLEHHRALIFVGACGIAVRLIAPYIKDKLSDPPVLVVDELAQFVIPILSGHMGGANELAIELAGRLGATPVITTATDLHGCFAVDLFAKKNGLTIVNKEGIAQVSSRSLRGEQITVAVAEGIEVSCAPEWIELVPYPPKGRADVLIALDIQENQENAILYLKARRLVLGIGCRKDKPLEELEAFIGSNLAKLGLEWSDVAVIASIDRKREEAGIVELAERYRIPFVVFSEEELRRVEGSFAHSEFVEQTVGVDNVCERAAMAACGGEGRLLLSKQKENGMTMAIAEKKVRLIWE